MYAIWMGVDKIYKKKGKEMIPKIIHYCWFGRGEKPVLAKRCIESWKKYCPDYEIIEWNEDNFDLSYCAYTRYCYDNKKWAFLSDLVRLLVVEKHGGIYFDTDVEVISSFDDLLENEAFYAFENDKHVASGLGFGAVAGHQTVISMIEEYKKLSCDNKGNIEIVGCPTLNTQALIPMGLKLNGELQKVAGALILPANYMNPYDDPTGRLNKTSNTLSIHWYSKSALSKMSIIRSRLTRPFHRVFGVDCFKYLRRKKR